MKKTSLAAKVTNKRVCLMPTAKTTTETKMVKKRVNRQSRKRMTKRPVKMSRRKTLKLETNKAKKKCSKGIWKGEKREKRSRKNRLRSQKKKRY